MPGQREDLRVHRVVEAGRVAVLEVGAPAAANQERVAGERDPHRVHHERPEQPRSYFKVYQLQYFNSELFPIRISQ